MNDFVTLSCPSCGGKLSVQKNSPTYTCEFCGTEHKLREEDIEFFGRCPRCHRNDRVEKLTAILNKNDQLAKKFRPPVNIKAVRYHRLIDSTKTDKSVDWIMIPEKQVSIFTKKSRPFFYGSIAAFIVFVSIISNTSSGFMTFLSMVCLLGSIALLVFGIINSIKGKKDLNKYYKELLNQKSIQEQKMSNRYNKIYYCQRDDILFIPGEESFATSSDYEDFVTQALD